MIIKAISSTMGHANPSVHARKPYEWRGIPGWTPAPVVPPEPDEEILSPQQIVARLRREIAAKSPKHAELVAAFEGIPRDELESWDPAEESATARQAARAARRRRLREYGVLRSTGLSKAQAAREMGLATRTASDYERDMRAMMRGGVR